MSSIYIYGSIIDKTMIQLFFGTLQGSETPNGYDTADKSFFQKTSTDESSIYIKRAGAILVYGPN